MLTALPGAACNPRPKLALIGGSLSPYHGYVRCSGGHFGGRASSQPGPIGILRIEPSLDRIADRRPLGVNHRRTTLDRAVVGDSASTTAPPQETVRWTRQGKR